MCTFEDLSENQWQTWAFHGDLTGDLMGRNGDVPWDLLGFHGGNAHPYVAWELHGPIGFKPDMLSAVP